MIMKNIIIKGKTYLFFEVPDDFLNKLIDIGVSSIRKNKIRILLKVFQEELIKSIS